MGGPCRLVRCVFGNPFHPAPALDPAVLASCPRQTPAGKWAGAGCGEGKLGRIEPIA
jgi:hypothetical protein